jgi:hypothetical protein
MDSEFEPDPVALAQVYLTRCQSAAEHDALIDFLAAMKDESDGK